ncbi:hypothetical protein V8E36_002391, partial [Tilletia maclaganii]
WVDDWTLLLSDTNTKRLRQRAQQYCDKAGLWAASHHATFDRDKTSLCIMPSKRRKDKPGAMHVRLSGNAVRIEETVKVLGVTFQADGRFDAHAAITVRKETAALGFLLSWGTRTWGFSADNARTLYNAGVAPLFEYACSVWLPPAGVKGGQGHLGMLKKVQRAASVFITGAFRSTATESLNLEASLLSVHILPATHPLARAVDQACEAPYKRGRRPLHLLASAYPDVATAALSRRVAPVNAAPNNFPVVICESKEAAKRYHNALRSAEDAAAGVIHAYTDGSGIDGRFGAAVTIYGPDGGEATDYEKGLGTRSTVFRAEVQAVLMALTHIPDEATAFIWTDSQAVALALRQARQYDPDISLAQSQLNARDGRVAVIWIPGHRDLQGNELADKAAKRAAASSCPAEKTELAVVRQLTMRKAKEQWQKEWDRSSKGAHHRRTNTVLVGRANKLYRGLSRPLCSLLAQLRTNHIGLNDYLFWRKLVDSAFCDRCKRRETREHLLTGCHRFRREREALRRRVGLGPATSLKRLLNQVQTAREALRLAAGRFDCYRRRLEELEDKEDEKEDREKEEEERLGAGEAQGDGA